MPEELSRNRFDVILQHDWSIEQCLLHIRVFFGGKTKSPCFVLFTHWLIKQITNTYRNHFSKTYENRSIEGIRNRGPFSVKNGMQRGKRLDTRRNLISLTCPTHSTSLRSCNVTAGVGSAKEPCSTILPRSDIIHRYDPCCHFCRSHSSTR